MDLKLKGKTIMVTGAAKGIGKGIALQAANEGANIVLHYYRSSEEAMSTASEIEKVGSEVLLVQGDLSNMEDVEEMKGKIDKKFGSLYGIVNNAGWTPPKRFFDYGPGEWKREVDVCYYGVMNLTHVFMKDMMKNQEGKFINIIGDSARTGDKNLIISSSARAGTISFLKSLSQDVGRYNIQCNTLSLGVVDQGYLHEHIPTDEETLNKIKRRYPLKRIGDIDDVTGTVIFFLSHWTDWITGQVISVNGGQSMIG